MSIISELSKLIDAGFTKEDIAKFYTSKEIDSKKIDSKETIDSVDDKTDENKAIDSLTSQISELTKLMQASNIFKDEQPKPRTIDDIFESMFNEED